MNNSLVQKIHSANTTLITKGELDKISHFFAADYSVHITRRVLTGGHKIVNNILSTILHSFHDIQIEIDILLHCDDRVAWQRTLQATHARKFKNFPASDRQIIWRDMVTSQFRDGLIVEEWVVTDLAEQLLLSRKTTNKGSANQIAGK